MVLDTYVNHCERGFFKGVVGKGNGNGSEEIAMSKEDDVPCDRYQDLLQGYPKNFCQMHVLLPATLVTSICFIAKEFWQVLQSQSAFCSDCSKSSEAGIATIATPFT